MENEALGARLVAAKLEPKRLVIESNFLSKSDPSQDTLIWEPAASQKCFQICDL